MLRLLSDSHSHPHFSGIKALICRLWSCCKLHTCAGAARSLESARKSCSCLFLQAPVSQHRFRKGKRKRKWARSRGTAGENKRPERGLCTVTTYHDARAVKAPASRSVELNIIQVTEPLVPYERKRGKTPYSPKRLGKFWVDEQRANMNSRVPSSEDIQHGEIIDRDASEASSNASEVSVLYHEELQDEGRVARETAPRSAVPLTKIESHNVQEKLRI